MKKLTLTAIAGLLLTTPAHAQNFRWTRTKVADVVKQQQETASVQVVDLTQDKSGVDDTGGGGILNYIVAGIKNLFEAPTGVNGVVSNNNFHQVILKDQVLAVKVDFSQRNGVGTQLGYRVDSYFKKEGVELGEDLFLPIRGEGNDLAPYRQIRGGYSILKWVDRNGQQHEKEVLREAAVAAAIRTPGPRGGHNGELYRIAQEYKFFIRDYLDNRFSVSVSRTAGDMNSVVDECISGTTFFLTTDAGTQEPAPRNCNRILRNADGSENKVWYINIKLNHCDYVDTEYKPTFPIRRNEPNGVIGPSGEIVRSVPIGGFINYRYEVKPQSSEPNCAAKVEISKYENHIR